MFLLLMLALSTTLALSFFILHQTTKIAVAISLDEDVCTITPPETNRTAVLSNNSYAIDINASNISSAFNISQNVLQHEKHSSASNLISKQNVTRQQVLAELNREEPNYHEAAKLGPGA